jgi:hypothetical protein
MQAKNGSSFVMAALQRMPTNSKINPAQLFQSASDEVSADDSIHQITLSLRHCLSLLLTRLSPAQVAQMMNVEIDRVQTHGLAGMLMAIGRQQRKRSGAPNDDTWFGQVYQESQTTPIEMPTPHLKLPPLPNDLIGMETLKNAIFHLNGPAQQLSISLPDKPSRVKKSKGEESKKKKFEAEPEDDPDEVIIQVGKATQAHLRRLGYTVTPAE